MVCTVIGSKYSAVADENNNRQLKEYFKVFLIAKAPRSNEYSQYEGFQCFEQSVNVNDFKFLEIDKKYNFEFDKKGKLIDILPNDEV